MPRPQPPPRPPRFLADFQRILDNITRPIPAPAQPPDPPTAQFRTLRLGDVVHSPTGTVHTVVACTRRMATLEPPAQLTAWPTEGWTKPRRARRARPARPATGATK